ncbi:Hypothetical_protein [Hexamita inflata]|uniref:Hypothetical_protein n=1 Tax=Hexamita inflata TaxID=28002 RepID=A0AA86UJP8_9EUKA|nr:Hypothetical protein HINF_LOCUS41417 [Hexamita inflata]
MFKVPTKLAQIKAREVISPQNSDASSLPPPVRDQETDAGCEQAKTLSDQLQRERGRSVSLHDAAPARQHPRGKGAHEAPQHPEQRWAEQERFLLQCGRMKLFRNQIQYSE